MDELAPRKSRLPLASRGELTQLLAGIMRATERRFSSKITQRELLTLLDNTEKQIQIYCDKQSRGAQAVGLKWALDKLIENDVHFPHTQVQIEDRLAELDSAPKPTKETAEDE